MNDLDKQVRRLVRTVLALMEASYAGWVSWWQVAKHQSGSTEGAEILSGLASLPQFRHLFATKANQVKLTVEGLEFARSFSEEDQSLTEMIANAINGYARSQTPIVLDIEKLFVVAKVKNKFVHAIQVDLSDEILPNETPVIIRCLGSGDVYGKLVGQESDGDVLYVACDTDVSPSQLPVKLVIDKAFLLTQLSDQIRQLPTVPDRLLSIFKESDRSLIADANSTVVADKLAQLKTPWTQFLWGPPGAGKTFGLAHLVTQLLLRHPNETILIVAPSNRAVDVAVSHLRTRFSVNSLDQLVRDRRVLRFGYPRKADVLEVPELLGPAILDELSKQAQQISRKIIAKEREQGNDSDLAVLRAELLAAQEAVRDAVRDHVAQCCVVATTTTLAYLPRSPIASQMWDTVIVDEVTMVSPALCAFLASRAKQRFLLAGDPCQLGPVFEDGKAVADETTEDWLKCDVFTTAGVSSGVLSPDAISGTDSRLARISAQRRCADDIWNRISHLYPQVVNAANPNRLRTIAALRPVPGASVVFVNLARRGAKCEKMKRSWQNIASAQVAMQVAATIASQALGNCRIAIICPYRAQVKILREWIRNEQRDGSSPFGSAVVEAGTVHQFQGSEADAVIFDLVDGPGRPNLGLLLSGDTGTRLVNVAISRARGKLVVIADQDWCRQADVSLNNSLLSKLVFGGVSMNVVSPDEFSHVPLKHPGNSVAK